MRPLPFPPTHPALLSALTRRSYLEPTPVQAAVLAAEAQDRDLLVSAQTGSGKTVAFGLALAKPLLGDALRFTSAGAPLALIVTPTRELALQVHRELSWLYADTGARITTCVGGMDPSRERNALRQGVHVVVGTPGRLCDHLERGALVLAKLSAVVLDEADEMLDMGFREDLERLLEASPAERRTLMFSATIPKEIATLAKRYQKQALRIATSSEADRHVDIEYQAVPIVPRERDLAVVNLLRYHEGVGALVFCATRDGTTRLAANLNERGFSVVALSGELSQRERNLALQALRDGRARVCVATDVAARGLDLPDLGLVIHADLPQNKQMLVHRSGRTGRAGKHGIAIILVPDAGRRYVERTLHSAHIDAKWMRGPSSDDILQRDQELLIKEMTAMTEEPSEEDRQVARALLEKKTAEDLTAALVRLRRQARPAPEELTVPPSMRPQRPRDHEQRAPHREPPRAHREPTPHPRGDEQRPRRENAPLPRRDHEARPARDHEARPARDHAARPARDHEARPARDHEARPARDHEARPARDHEARPARDHEARPARDHEARPARDHEARPARAPAHRDQDAAPARPSRDYKARPGRDHEAPAPEAGPAPESGVAPARDQEARPAGEPAHRDQEARPAREPAEARPAREPYRDAEPRFAHDAESRPRRDHAPLPRRDHEHPVIAAGNTVWFTINVGRSKNADPKWLIPLLCRRGNITKREIGKIQILARETRVEITGDASAKFAESVRKPDEKDRNIHIEPLDSPR
ncbi:MAG: box helicase [Myxococcales bacterium]|nr:box helicase [Myxococcales bacterium]